MYGINVLYKKTKMHMFCRYFFLYFQQAEEAAHANYHGNTIAELMEELFDEKSCSYRVYKLGQQGSLLINKLQSEHFLQFKQILPLNLIVYQIV